MQYRPLIALSSEIDSLLEFKSPSIFLSSILYAWLPSAIIMLSIFQSITSIALIASFATSARLPDMNSRIPVADRFISNAPTPKPSARVPSDLNSSADPNATNSTPRCPAPEALDPEAFLPRSLPLGQLLPLTSIYAFIFVTGVLGNAVTLAVLLANRHMRTATNAYLANLAIADLVFLLSGLPLEVHDFFVLYPFPFPEWVCKVCAPIWSISRASVQTWFLRNSMHCCRIRLLN